MTGALAGALAARSPRERQLLAAMVVIVLPLGLWFGVLAPMMAARDAAERDLAQALATRDWVAVQAAAFAPDAAREAVAARGIAGIEASLSEAGLRGDARRLEQGQGGRVLLAFDAVEWAALLAYADGLAALGYAIEEMTIAATDRPGEVSATLDLVPSSGGIEE